MTDTIFTGNVLRLAFGGEGIIHQEGLVVFVPFTAPGDIVKYKIKEQKKNFAFGELLEILTPSKERILPKCPYFGICGGCQIQHLDYPSQLEYKRQSIQDALSRQAKLPNVIVPPVIPAQQQWFYRRRINLTLKPCHNHYTAGYMAIDRTLLSIEQCPIFVEPKDLIFQQIKEIAKLLIPQNNEIGKLTILKNNSESFLLNFHFKDLPMNAEIVLANALDRFPNWAGIVASSPKKTLQFGKLETHLLIDGLDLTFSPKTFIQNHPEQSLNIYHSLEAHAKNSNSKNILDLYCGIGISSLLLARQGSKVTGIEANKEAISLAEKNAKTNSIHSADFFTSDVQHILKNMLNTLNPDLVIINPPREGLDPAVVNTLLKNPPPVMIYISCMPPTLARDLKLLCSESYKISAIEAYDMFPQTSHVETLVVLNRST